MIVSTITDKIIRFTFDTSPTKYATLSCYLIHNFNKAILIDTGFQHQTKEILQYCKNANIVIEAVIISHFHWDHIAGLPLLKDIPIYGRANALESQQKLPKQKRMEPTIKITSPTSIPFERTLIECIPNPGHSISTMMIKINKSILMVADDILYSKNNEPIIPFLADLNLNNQIRALQVIRDEEFDMLLLSHGPVLKDFTFIQQDIKNRLTYLTALKNDPTISYSDFSQKHGIDFQASNWHKYNQKAARESK